MQFLRRALVAIAAMGFIAAGAGAAADEETAAPPSKLLKSTADHSKFKALQRVFSSGPEVTKACLSCHTEASKQLHQTQHWKWEYINPATRQKLGKKHVINNFCTSVSSNYKACASCHIGYGLKDEGFDFASEENVDCLVCHDSTGKYKGYVTVACGNTPIAARSILSGVSSRRVSSARRQPR